MLRALKIFTVSLVMLVTAVAGTAHAYLDPGTGSYILQLLLAALLGAVFTVKIYWQKLKMWLSSIFSKSSSDNDSRE